MGFPRVGGGGDTATGEAAMTEPGAPADFDAMIGLRVVSYDGDVLGTLEEVYHDSARTPA